MLLVFKTLFVSFLLGFTPLVNAAEVMSTSNSLVRMLIGLAIVLCVLAVVAWVMKKTMRGKLGHQNAIKVVDGVTVGTRERVMVLEVADRWLVVGVAAGQVTGLANLPISETTSDNSSDQQNHSTDSNHPLQPKSAFSSLLAKATKQQEKL